MSDQSSWSKSWKLPLVRDVLGLFLRPPDDHAVAPAEHIHILTVVVAAAAHLCESRRAPINREEEQQQRRRQRAAEGASPARRPPRPRQTNRRTAHAVVREPFSSGSPKGRVCRVFATGLPRRRKKQRERDEEDGCCERIEWPRRGRLEADALLCGLNSDEGGAEAGESGESRGTPDSMLEQSGLAPLFPPMRAQMQPSAPPMLQQSTQRQNIKTLGTTRAETRKSSEASRADACEVTWHVRQQ